MTAARVTAMMRLLTLEPERAAAAREMTAERIRAEYGLDPVEADAVVERRVDVLYRSGVHEVTLMQFARTFGFSIAERWAELSR